MTMCGPQPSRLTVSSCAKGSHFGTSDRSCSRTLPSHGLCYKRWLGACATPNARPALVDVPLAATPYVMNRCWVTVAGRPCQKHSAYVEGEELLLIGGPRRSDV